MNRTRQIVPSDDEADELMPKRPGAKKGPSKQNLQHRRQKKNGCDDDSISVCSDMDVDEDSREEKKHEVATSTGSRVSDSHTTKCYVWVMTVTAG
jgi:hypothetical protein